MRQAILRARRALLPAVTGLAVAGASWGAQAAGDTRTLSFYNIHSKETVTVTFMREGKLLPEGTKQINYIMRDWRRNEPTEMDPELINTIWEIYQELGSREPIHLVSGYRSKKTNEKLRRRGGGQARKSQHILGKAADIHFPDIPVKKLRNSALVREVGGVGYYPRSGLPFVHVDTGRVRNWPRLPRQELAALFPSGKTKYMPRDGRPITKRDSRIALAKLDRNIDNFIARKSKIKLPAKILMAGFTPSSLKWPRASMETTASIPRETPPAPPAGPDLAALRTAALSPAPKTVVAKAPAATPEIAITQLGGAEHPEELSYQPFSVTPLLGDARVASDRALAQLTAPGADEEDYLFRDPEGGYSASLAKGLGYTQKLALVTFGASANKAAGAVATKAIRTASR
ncbi:peptidase M15 [bacterium BMS3Bbin10]|nr:peptidase M15 [bacterium BMS3Bbin10]